MHFIFHILIPTYLDNYIFRIEIVGPFGKNHVDYAVKHLDISFDIGFNAINDYFLLIFPKCLLNILNVNLYPFQLEIGHFLLCYPIFTIMIAYLCVPNWS